jgi:hypothetical protein
MEPTSKPDPFKIEVQQIALRAEQHDLATLPRKRNYVLIITNLQPRGYESLGLQHAFEPLGSYNHQILQ